jgi:outer membrane protein
MQIKSRYIFLLFLFNIFNIYAQETVLNLKEAISLAITNSNEATLADTKADTKKLEFEVTKNLQYPDLKMSGQYSRLAGATVDLKSQGQNAGTAPAVNELIIGQATINYPLFAGFKIRNTIKANENLYKAELSKKIQTKEEIAMKVVEYYANLYRAQKTVSLITENLKSAEQRVKDFSNLEQNGVIARNDLLKAQLQQSKVQLSLDESKRNVSVLNYYLVTLMKLPENYKIGIDEHQFDNSKNELTIRTFQDALKNRKDLDAIHYFQKASENSIAIAKSSYYPSLVLKGGYTTLSLQNVVTVTNALDFGLGISYDLSSILKNGKSVKVAKSKLVEAKQTEEILSENIKIQVQQASENYDLAIKQNLVYQQAITQATENYRIVKDKYDNGLSNTNDLLEADVEQLNSKLNYALSRANVFLKYYEMQASSGLLTFSFNLSNK